MIPTIKINNKNDWWNAVNTYGKELISINERLNIGIPSPQDNAIAEGSIKGESIEQYFHRMLDLRNWQGIHKLLHKIWASLPDNRSIHSLDGFYLLCDLCSETWVFDD